MGTKTVRLDEEVYRRIRAHKREDETFSEAIDRLVDDWSLLDFDTGRSDEEIERHGQLLEEAEETSEEDTKEMLQRVGVDVE